MLVFDTLYSDVDHHTKDLIIQMFGTGLEIMMGSVPKQKGGKDCGVFAIAICTSLAYTQLSNTYRYNQIVMRNHLIQCYENMSLSLFPSV